MTEQVLRNNRGVIIGRIATERDSQQILRDARGVIKGSYNPRDNVTRDARGSPVGTGNLLVTLL